MSRAAPDPLVANASEMHRYEHDLEHRALHEFAEVMKPTWAEVTRTIAWVRRQAPAMIKYAEEQRRALDTAGWEKHPRLNGTSLVKDARDIIQGILEVPMRLYAAEGLLRRCQHLSEAAIKEGEFGEQCRRWRSDLSRAVPGFNKAGLEELMAQIRARVSGVPALGPDPGSGPRFDMRPPRQTVAHHGSAAFRD